MSDLLGALIAGAFALYGLAYLVVLYVEEIRRPHRPFHVGKLYPPGQRPGPYPNGDCDASQLAALGAQLAGCSLCSYEGFQVIATMLEAVYV